MFKKISHIGVVVDDLEAATKHWCEAYGLKVYSEYSTEAEDIKAVLLSVSGQPGEMSIELLEPLDKSDMSNAVARRLARAGEGFYHLAVEVDDVAGTAQELRAQGRSVIDRDPVAEGDDRRWVLHPRESNGILVEGIGEAPLQPPTSRRVPTAD